MPRDDRDKQLAELAGRANDAHERELESGRELYGHRLEIGVALTEARERCKHGTWLPWLKANVTFSQRHAYHCIDFAAEVARRANLPADPDAELEAYEDIWREVRGGGKAEDDSRKGGPANGPSGPTRDGTPGYAPQPDGTVRVKVALGDYDSGISLPAEDADALQSAIDTLNGMPEDRLPGGAIMVFLTAGMEAVIAQAEEARESRKRAWQEQTKEFGEAS
jgi:hypothetical protein